MKNAGTISKSRSRLKKMWMLMPLWLRAILTGFLVNTLGVGTWVILVSTVPFPWSLLMMAVILWLYVKYFSGHWGPEHTKGDRKRSFRAFKLTKGVWKWSVLSALLFIVLFQSGLMFTFRIIEYPAEIFKSEYNFGGIPVWMSWLFLIMASLVAGICEETGFRGYMQVPLEDRYGPRVAIIIVSFVFVLAHLHQAWAWPILFQLFMASAFIGILAFRTGSLIPGFIAHAGLDIFNFSYWWSDVLGKFEKRPIGESGIDGHFVFWTIVFVLSLFLFFRLTARARDIRLEKLETQSSSC